VRRSISVDEYRQSAVTSPKISHLIEMSHAGDLIRTGAWNSRVWGRAVCGHRATNRDTLSGGISGVRADGPNVLRSGLGFGIRRRRMTEEERVELKAQLERLRQEHRDLDAAIEALQAVPGSDVIQVQRLKKRKLVLRDRITFIEDQLTPDIIA
jgi:hypothetical protein